MSTVDLKIAETVKMMHAKLRKPGLQDLSKFRMVSSCGSIAQVQIKTLSKDG